MVILAGLLLLVPSGAYGQISDTTPPKLVNLLLAPTTIDTSSSGQSVTVTADVQDDLAGFSWLFLLFISPSGNQYQWGSIGSWQIVSGNDLNGQFQGTVDFPRFSEAGTWRVGEITLCDNTSNCASLDTAELEAANLPTLLEVTSNQDVTPPILTSLSISPSVVDVSSGVQDVTITFGVSDDISGFDVPVSANRSYYTLIWLYSPSQNQYHWAIYNNARLVSGTSLNGIVEVVVRIPQYSEPGNWQIGYLALFDTAGNTNYYYPSWNWPADTPSSFTVSSAPFDTTPPSLTNLTITPALIDTSTGGQTVNLTLTLTDGLAGLHEYTQGYSSYCFGGVNLVSPSGGQQRYACIWQDWQLISGTPLDGVWQTDAWFPQYSEAGTWNISYVDFFDGARNSRTMDTAALKAAGFPTELVVIKPSLTGDGEIDASGGTVQDSVFGNRAQITLPPGAVQVPTEIAIDVFADPLDIPVPTGFAAAGTNFVNIHLTPEPNYPLGPPGMTIVLPLLSHRIPGTSLFLFSVDAFTGSLIPAIGVDNQPVIGTVDAPDGMSATFKGVAQLSVVVGLVPQTIPVTIDIKPGSDTNSINPKSKGKIPVAILSTQNFSAPDLVDTSTLTFGRTGDETSLAFCNPNGEDVNGDGYDDLVCHFYAQTGGFQCGDNVGFLKGKTTDNIPIEGTDSVRISPCD